MSDKLSAETNNDAQARIDRVREVLAEARGDETYCRYCGGVIFPVGGKATRTWTAKDSKNAWCKHWPEGKRVLN